MATAWDATASIRYRGHPPLDRHSGDIDGARTDEYVDHSIQCIAIDDRRRRARTDQRQVLEDVEIARSRGILGGPGEREIVGGRGDAHRIGPRNGIGVLERLAEASLGRAPGATIVIPIGRVADHTE